MNRLFAWLFHNSEYERTQKIFSEITHRYREGYRVWCYSTNGPTSGWSHEQMVAKDYEKIKHLDEVVKLTTSLNENQGMGLWHMMGKSRKRSIQRTADYLWVEKNQKEILSKDAIISKLYSDMRKDVRYNARSSSIKKTRRILMLTIFEEVKSMAERSEIDEVVSFAQNYDDIQVWSNAVDTYINMLAFQKVGLDYFLKESKKGSIDSYIDCLWIEGKQKKIEEIDKNIKLYQELKKLHADGIEALLEANKKKAVSNHKDCLWVLERQKEVKRLDAAIKDTKKLPKAKAVLTGGKKNISTTELVDKYEEYKKKGIDLKKLDKMIGLSKDYPLSWKLFATRVGNIYTKSFIEKACKVSIDSWENKEKLLNLMNKQKSLVDIIIGTRKYDPKEFTNDALVIEKSILKELSQEPKDYSINEYDCCLGDGDELKRLIVDYDGYGEKINFTSKFTISKFYSYRINIEDTGRRFADLVQITKENSAAISAYNSSHGHKAATYIYDYIEMGEEDSTLYQYVLEYNKTQKAKNEAKALAKNFSLGFSQLVGNVDIDELSFGKLENILRQEEEIRNLDGRLKAEKRRREQEEKEREARRREIERWENAVSSWSTPSYSSVRYFSLYNYYPTTCDWQASQEEWNIRNLIWNFKANPNKPMSEAEIIRRHNSAVETLLPDLLKCLNQFFGSNLSDLTLVCIPSSKKVVTERRYESFSKTLTSETGMSNSYDYINVVEDGGAKHLGESGSAKYSINKSFFDGRRILLFDDVITSGRSIEKWAKFLRGCGAYVVGAVSIGRTRHQREDNNPIDLI
ncbi:hypothetical protein IX336_000233 [Porphyromonas levii]|uniref:phosphoribosyltransferase n=1 Tax=Porphyromonas levii TaxID=28114 RepID=UPI001BA7CDCC|nr:phosphoribosyltransferase [Porphyromonas levii]MBR8764880.1 hypothetical protein [Porphyromonas levii]